jgi:mycofactocin precursor
MQELETVVVKTQAGSNDTRAGDTETQESDEQAELVEELLIEEISIDGMCGVY